MTFGRELVVLLTKPSMFGKFLVHAWRFEQRTFYIGSWRVKLILACQEFFERTLGSKTGTDPWDLPN